MGTKDRVLIIDTVTVGRGKNMFTVESGEDYSVGSNAARVLDQWDPLIACPFLIGRRKLHLHPTPLQPGFPARDGPAARRKSF